MRHMRTISRGSTPAPGATTLFESIIILLMTVFFNSWDNFAPVIRNIEKFYRKT